MGALVEELVRVRGEIAYQLDRYVDTGGLIRKTVDKRLGSRSRRHSLSLDWRAEVDAALGAMPDESGDRASEDAARTEKAAALEELASSRLSVLLGPAGTGKTTLLKMLRRSDHAHRQQPPPGAWNGTPPLSPGLR